MDLSPALIQIFNGLVNGAFYALLSLGLAVIFGIMRVVNFAHGAFYMLGAFAGYLLLLNFNVPFWWALILAPVSIGALGMIVERLLIHRLYHLDPLYNFLLTFGLTLIIQDGMRLNFGLQGQPYSMPAELQGAVNLGIVFYPTFRFFVIAFSLVVCFAVWFLIEKTRVGMVVRAATEKPDLTRALGINVGRWITPVFGFGVALAALGGVLAAPMRNVSPLMGADLIIFTFAVVVIGGLGSILGSVVAGFLVGVLTSLPVIFNYPALANVVPFILMALILLWRPAGLFGSLEAK
jgi:branched-chain amino acid transport system permease protein